MTGKAVPAAADGVPSRRRLSLGAWVFVVLMLALSGVFVALGVWQVNRLAEKEALIAAVTSRIDLPPAALPPLAEWVGFDPEVFDYRPVTVTGRFVPDQTVLVFTSLGAPRGAYGGPGYWVVEPFALADGGTVLVNRGFVPQRLADSYATGGAGPDGTLTITGVARQTEEVSAFTPGTDIVHRREWVRNIARLTELMDPALAPFAPIYIDQRAGERGALPQGGETVVSFPNNHFGYAMTWFGFALLTPILLIIWIVRQLRGNRSPVVGPPAGAEEGTGEADRASP